MAKRADEVIIESLANRWNASSFPAAGTSCVASVSGPNPSTSCKINLDSLGWSARNATAAAVTLTLSVRDASLAGTTLAAWDVIVGTGVSQQDNFAVKVQGVRGNPLFIDFGTPAASVTQKISAAGWYDTLQNA
jgi:hypothetical protein